MTLKAVAPSGDGPAERALAAQDAAKHTANMVGDSIIADFRDVVERASIAFDLAAMDPAKRELMRRLKHQGALLLGVK